MAFPLSVLDISLWIAITAVILLVTSELLAPYSSFLGDFVIEKTRLRLVAMILGLAFMLSVILRIVMLQ